LRSSAFTIPKSSTVSLALLRSRRKRLFFLWLISVVTYLDRVNIAIAGPLIAQQHRLTRVELGTIFSVFVLGYTLFQIPGGMLGDRFKHKNVLSVALIWWSLFTAPTGWAGRAAVAANIGGISRVLDRTVFDWSSRSRYVPLDCRSIWLDLGFVLGRSGRSDRSYPVGLHWELFR
jgi:MFS family permease